MFVALHAVLAVVSAGHALLYKRDPRAALGWIAVSVVFPYLGPLMYYLFGINRVQTRARQLSGAAPRRFSVGFERADEQPAAQPPVVQLPDEYAELARVAATITRRPLCAHNTIEMLHNGEQVFPAMLAAIDAARQSLYLSTYILETNTTGRRFIDALSRATARGVAVRVLIDGVGEWYSRPRATSLLRKKGVRVASFLPPQLWPPSVHINLRNHRKILVADGDVAFTGGINIGDRHLADNLADPSRVADTHFRVCGPVVAQIEAVFIEDWRFVTGESLTPSPASQATAGDAICRTITDGPDEDLDKLTMILAGAVSAAHRSVAIVTPYFIPPRELTSALQAAALRGLQVSVVLPARNNLPYVHWATRNLLWDLLRYGVRIYYQPPPFAHTKLFVVDDLYAHIGSANLDPRSLRLNFELAVEVYERAFSQAVAGYIADINRRSRAVTLAEVDARPYPERARDAFCWLFSPYL
ncbi:MAG: PLDc N-terminal domain-containing protein [Gammaproteobacteria bacterium]|nr:PLDc N-terminal domain-containing protein [Gammaproteobacteria bacterium]